jgi:hypothetical protein
MPGISCRLPVLERFWLSFFFTPFPLHLQLTCSKHAFKIWRNSTQLVQCVCFASALLRIALLCLAVSFCMSLSPFSFFSRLPFKIALESKLEK